MRLDKLVGKALYNVPIHVVNWITNTELFYLSTGENFSDLKEEMKNYKVRYFEIRDNELYIGARKKED